MQTCSFDDLTFWIKDPISAFAEFISSEHFLALSKRRSIKRDVDGNVLPMAPLRKSSAQQYVAMFGKFHRWYVALGKSIVAVTSEDVLVFLEDLNEDGKKALNSSIRSAYLGLLERVFRHLRIDPNPAAQACAIIYQSGSRSRLGNNEAKALLTPGQEDAFMKALSVLEEGDEQDAMWKRHRDRAILAMMLGVAADRKLTHRAD